MIDISVQFQRYLLLKILTNEKESGVYTVSVLLEPRGSIFHYGFLGGVLFKFEQTGGVFKVGVY